MSRERPLRVVIDAQLVLRMFVVPLDRPDYEPPTRILLRHVGTPQLSWLWTPEILEDYRDGAAVMVSEPRFRARAEFDHQGFELLQGLFYQSPPVEVTAGTIAAARSRISQSARVRARDTDDAIYLACAVDGRADFVASNDQSILSLGAEYDSVRIADVRQLREELLRLD
ncbi:MAG TPA: PIN domain-containing protein [Blastocatellia bacterium]|nr:PIN domain-containing protein [Blastocatellia bacterium]